MIGFYTTIEKLNIEELELFLKNEHSNAEIELAKNRLKSLQEERDFHIKFNKQLKSDYYKCSSTTSYIHYICKYSSNGNSNEFVKLARKKVGEKFITDIREASMKYPDTFSDFEKSFFNFCKAYGVYSVYILFYPNGKYATEAKKHQDRPRKVWISTILLPILTALLLLSIVIVLIFL